MIEYIIKIHILTGICYFTRWMEAVPLADESAESVAKAMLKFVARHGCPSRVVTDGGPCFTARTMQLFEKGLGLKHHVVAAYKPTCNSRLERVHRTLGRKLKTQVLQTGDYEWDEVCRADCKRTQDTAYNFGIRC